MKAPSGYLVLALLTALICATAVCAAQTTSCPAADAQIPPSLKAGGLKVSRDRFTDSTLLRTAVDTRALASMGIEAAWAGTRPPADSVKLMFVFKVRTVSFNSAVEVTPAMAEYNDKSTVFLLLDGNERLSLESPIYHGQLESGIKGLAPPEYDEAMHFRITLAQLVQMARAKSVEMKVTSFNTRINAKVFEGARELVRQLLCGQGL